jgi:hypothetical protein
MAGRICKEEGCDRPATGRGMCRTHYNAWNRKNPGITMMETNRQALLDAMPATIPKLIEKTGLTRPTVMRQLNVSGEERRAHIYDWEPPAQVGKNWQAIYRQGAGPNKRLTDERKKEHNNMMDRASAARRNPALVPMIRRRKATWFGPLGAIGG